MDKLVIDLNNKDLQEFKSVLTPFASSVRGMLLDLYSVGYDFPVSLRGTQRQIEAFFKTLKNEKRYMDSYMKHGLGDPRTMGNKSDLARAIAAFEKETGLPWPFKN